MTPVAPMNIAPRMASEDEPVTVSRSQQVIIKCPEDPTPEQMMRVVEASGVLRFWDDPREDIYSLEDGRPV